MAMTSDTRTGLTTLATATIESLVLSEDGELEPKECESSPEPRSISQSLWERSLNWEPISERIP